MIALNPFLHQKQYCKECGLEKLRGSSHHAWRKDRDELRRIALFRKRIYKALSSSLKAVGKDKIGRTSDILGYGPKELQEHVARHPNWPRVKDKQWHLDHIFPIQAFVDNGIDDVSLINCLKNLQPITQQENNRKKDKYNQADFQKWLKGHSYELP